MTASERRMLLRAFAVPAVIILIVWLASANLGGLIILLPALPATPAAIGSFITELRLRRDLNQGPSWL